MISNFDNCLYIHIPKTAGQSIESVFLERAGLSWAQRDVMLLKRNSDPKKGPPRLAHLTALEYLEKGYLDKSSFNDLTKFTFVRNPWDRLVSEYRYKQHKFSFKDFIFKHLPKVNEDDYLNHNGLYRHIMPQHLFIYNQQQELMVDFVGKFENLNNDFHIISEMICHQKLDLPHKNKTAEKSLKEILISPFKQLKKSNSSSHKCYQDFYDKESQEYIAELYAKDIELFDYIF